MLFEDLNIYLEDLNARMSSEERRGAVATYIPELACIDTKYFGMSICLANGKSLSCGDASHPFSIQSVSKVFSLAIALGRYGDNLWLRVGREPSSRAFNSVQELEVEDGRPLNPFVNAGAIVTTDSLLVSHTPKETLGEIIEFIRAAADDNDIHINSAVADSEFREGDRNKSLAYFLRSAGNLKNEVDIALGTYFHQCAIEMTTLQLARAGRFLAGISPQNRLLSPTLIRSINGLMMTCGHYDGSGDFAYRVGFPGKSGVGGGILAIVPGVASIAVWSPGLNRYGNSKLGTMALEGLSHFTGWSLFQISPKK